ncbi:unnamed protein product [marine sediment metagenome]|uniref:Uncharacterized protein n=1 Tax=marine sediment metagenome TaxID=412755 RepID=X1LPC7_9ZZZZ
MRRAIARGRMLPQLSKNTKQIHKYEGYGLPVFVCGRPESISEVVDLILSSYYSHDFEHI